MDKSVNIHDSRYRILRDEFPKEYFQHIIHFLKNEKRTWKVISPAWQDIFRAFELTHRENVNVVILGQDPYHGPGQAHGLCFSVPPTITPPPSLVNIFKEIAQEYPEYKVNTTNGDLTHRATQWVLLLNAFLTVQESAPLSHCTIGREFFTDQIIKTISDQKQWVVFMLRGSFAQSKQSLIDTTPYGGQEQKHLVLTASHPSPLSANRWWWFGNSHFRLCNEYLKKQGKKEIQWIGGGEIQ